MTELTKEQVEIWLAAHWDGPFNAAKDRLCRAVLQSLDREGQDMSAAELGKRIQDGERWKLADDGQINAAPQESLAKSARVVPSSTVRDKPGEKEVSPAGAAPDFDAGLAARIQKAAEHVVWFDWSPNDCDAVEAIEELRRALKGTQK